VGDNVAYMKGTKCGKCRGDYNNNNEKIRGQNENDKFPEKNFIYNKRMCM